MDRVKLVELVVKLEHVYGMRDSLKALALWSAEAKWWQEQPWSSPLVAAIVECIAVEEERQAAEGGTP